MDREEERSDTGDSSEVEESENGSEEELSDFENSDEENIDDDYFGQYVDVNVGDVLDEVVGSSQRMIVEPNQVDERYIAEVREEDVLAMLSDYESEEIEEVDGLNDDEDESVAKVKYPKYNPSEMCKEFQFKLGMEFTSLQQFKDAVREYALLSGYEVKFVKNDKVRCRVKCAQKECNWLIFVSEGGGGELTYRVKTFRAKHTCGVSIKEKKATHKWISEKIVNIMKTTKNIKLSNIIASIRDHYMVDVSVWKAYKARKRAKAMLDGDYQEQYHKLRDYCNEVTKYNSETTFALVTDQQKGLVQAFEELLEGAEHRYCVPHLYSNIKTKYIGGTVVHDLVLRAAKATVQADWRERMNELKAVSSEAHDHLMRIPPTCLAKSHFDWTCKSDMITNNITESFNGRLLEAQELPIVSMLDWIRTYLIIRFAENRVKAKNYHGKGIVCPRPHKRLDREIQECQ